LTVWIGVSQTGVRRGVSGVPSVDSA